MKYLENLSWEKEDFNQEIKGWSSKLRELSKSCQRRVLKRTSQVQNQEKLNRYARGSVDK